MSFKLEEAEWVGLKVWEAVTKQKNIEKQRLLKNIQPYKELFAEETLKKLSSGEMDADAKLLALKSPEEYNFKCSKFLNLILTLDVTNCTLRSNT